MEPKSVNTTVSSVLQIAPGASGPDGADSSALDFAQVILASQGSSGAGAEQHQGKNHSKSTADIPSNSSPDDTLAVSGNPLAMKMFQPKAGFIDGEEVVKEGLEIGALSQAAGEIKALVLDVGEVDGDIDPTALPAGPDAILAVEAEMDAEQPLGMTVATIGSSGDPVSDVSGNADADNLTAVAAARKLDQNKNQDPDIAIEGDIAASVVADQNLNPSMQNDTRLAAVSADENAVQVSNAPPVSLVATSPAASEGIEAEDSLEMTEIKQVVSVAHTGKPAAAEGAAASSDAASLAKPSADSVLVAKPSADSVLVAKPPADSDLVEKPVQKIVADGVDGASKNQAPKEHHNHKVAADEVKPHSATQVVAKAQAVVAVDAERPITEQTPLISDEDGVVKAVDSAAKGSDVAVKAQDVGSKSVEVGVQATSPQQVRADGRSFDANQVSATDVASTNVRPAPIGPVTALESEAKPIVMAAPAKTASAPAIPADSVPNAASQVQKSTQADVAQKPVAAKTDLVAEKNHTMAAPDKAVPKAKPQQNLVTSQAAKTPQTAEMNAPLRSEVKAISAPVVTTQAAVAKQGAEAASNAAPVQAEIANQMKRSQESKAAEKNVNLKGLDDQLEETVIQARPQKAAPALEVRALRSAQIDAAPPMPADPVETSEPTEAEQALNEIMAPVSAGSGQPQAVAPSAANTVTPSQNLAALERWSNSIVDVQKQGWTQSLVRRVAAMPTNGGSLVITLQPASLGKITVSMSESRRGLDLRMRTETGATAALLTDAEGRISELLESAGMRLNSFSADTSGSFAENDNKSDESDTNDQSDLDFAQELPENVEQSTALQGDGLVNVIA
ncbi:MAG: flagellar hook-length control protein FliK [Paracoccaceae bacterium]|nr:flagellar hook-length control protein FliK [Paracoccaceae bacterium]